MLGKLNTLPHHKSKKKYMGIWRLSSNGNVHYSFRMKLYEYLEEIYCLKYLLPEEDQKIIHIHVKKLLKQCKPMEDEGNNET